MEFVKLVLNQKHGIYSYAGASSESMSTLGFFLLDDVGYHSSSFKEWGVNDQWGEACSGNITALEKDGDYILLSDLFPQEGVSTELKMTREQYMQVITDWDKVLKLKPKEVIIKYENDQFIMETKD